MPALRVALLIAAVAILYFLSGWLALAFFSPAHPVVVALWPPSGVAIAALCVLGMRVWPGVLLGAFGINVFTQGADVPAAAVAAGNTVEAIAAATLIARFAGGAETFSQLRNVLTFAAICLLAATIAATVGVATLTLGGDSPRASFAILWVTWWLGDSAGAILTAPLLMLWYRERRWPWSMRRLVEASVLLASAIAISLVTFGSPVAAYPPAFLFLPLLFWAAFRFGPREVATVVALLSVVAAWGTAQGNGPFAVQSPSQSLLVLQAFMIMMSLCTLPVAGLIQERSTLHLRERAARAEAEAANRSKDEFLAMLSHELRNPLSAITAATAVLDGLAAPDDESARWRRTIRRQTRHLTRLIEDLLDVGRITADKLALRRRPLDLGDALQRCMNELSASGVLQRRRIELHPASLWIDGDPDRIHQVISNLVMNAVKYTPPDGRIQVALREDGRDAVLRVEDSGIGIAPEFLPRIFDLFAQGEQGLDRARGGLGIGLTLVRRLVELHGGHVQAFSEGPERGSVFIVRFPRIPAPAPARERPTPTSGARAPSRLLIVEDNADARASLAALLSLTGHVVEEAADGETGVDAALRMEPDVALVDIGLPGIDGYEVARRIRAARPQIRLVALTGYGRDEDQRKAREAGFDAHLLKPTGLDALLRVLSSVFASVPTPKSVVR